MTAPSMPWHCPACRGRRADAPQGLPLDPQRTCPACAATWPAVTGLPGGDTPVLFTDRDQAERLRLACEAILTSPAALIAAAQGDDDVARTLAVQVVTWAQAHWGRHADPPLPAPDLAWLREWMPNERDLPPGPVLVLGCGAGGELPCVALPDRELLALDANPALLQLARGLAVGTFEVLPWRSLADRIEFRPVTLPSTVREVLRRTDFACADALDPPLPGESCAAVVAFNLLDSVPDPFLLLQQCEALLQPGGVLLLSSPYHWQDAVTPRGRQLDAHLPPELGQREGVEALLQGRLIPGFLDTLRLERSADGVPWEVPVHVRYSARYLLHVVRLRKMGAHAAPPG